MKDKIKIFYKFNLDDVEINWTNKHTRSMYVYNRM